MMKKELIGLNNLKRNKMENCKWSYFKFNHFFQYTEDNVFKVIGKNKEDQWVVKFSSNIINKFKKII